jgi:thiol:disulfide interchange protein
MVLAAFVISVKASAGAASWGMQMQNPKFVIGMTTLVTLIALNLFGVFEINLPGMGAAGGLASREGSAGAFFNGALATLLATPCTAPFLAPALGFAFTQKAPIIVATFAAVAIGMASPYVILSFFPAWLKKLPKPGPWMERFKHAMGFPMLATAIWLSTVTLAQFGRHVALPLGLFLATTAFAVWIYGEFVQRGSSRRPWAGGLAVLTAMAAAFYFLPQIKKPDETWKTWSPAAVQAARAQGRPVLVDFTAEWCLTCKFNKKIIHSASVWEKIRNLNTATFIADNTDESPEIIAELNRYHRTGVPLVLIFPADPKAPAIVLPELLTPGIVLEALDRATKGVQLSSAK